MDLNMPTTMVNNNQENNQLLLNAIKNKFAAQSENEVAAFSPPKFNIPCLKISGDTKEGPTTNCNSSVPTTQLNQFLLQQLQEKHASDKGLVQNNAGFKFPQLQFGNRESGRDAKIELPLLKTSTQLNISTLTSAIHKLQVEDSSTFSHHSLPSTPAIDLTTALASKLIHHQGTPPTRDLNNKQRQNAEDFDIPFIECDRYDDTRKALILASTNEYCTTDVSQLPLCPTLMEPSAIGHFLDFDNKYDAPLPLKCLSLEFQQQSVKHSIITFQFDTKSPDDIVLEALSKYHRRYYN